MKLDQTYLLADKVKISTLLETRPNLFVSRQGKISTLVDIYHEHNNNGTTPNYYIGYVTFNPSGSVIIKTLQTKDETYPSLVITYKLPEDDDNYSSTTRECCLNIVEYLMMRNCNE